MSTCVRKFIKNQFNWSLTTIFNPRTWYFNPRTPNPGIFLANPRTENFFRAARSSFFFGLILYGSPLVQLIFV